MPEVGVEPTSCEGHDFESCAYTNSATPALPYINDFRYSLPAPDFKNFSLVLASTLFGYSSTIIIVKGVLDLVVFDLPVLCSLIRLSRFTVNPT